MIRLFAALALPEDVALGLMGRQRGLEGAAWRPRAALHLTLRFFGELNETQAEDLDGALAAIRQSSFSLVLSGVGAFAEEGRPRALYAAVEPSEPLARLAAKCETAARRIGLRGDPRRFQPHVTLAYLKTAPLDELGDWLAAHNLLRSPQFPVDRFGLYSSHLGRRGALYQLEREHWLT
jgi:2'-5' RNA ligase